MRTMEHCFSAGAVSAAVAVDCRCIEQRRAVYDARRAKRLGFGMTGGAASSGERISGSSGEWQKPHRSTLPI
jgi:hypothetical protein